MEPAGEEKLGPIRAFVAAVGAQFIYLLIRVFGRTVEPNAVPLAARTDGQRIHWRQGLPVLRLHYRIEPIA